MWWILILIVIVLIYWIGLPWVWPGLWPEKFRPCQNCDGRADKSGHLILNPFAWPYSGTSCLDSVYIDHRDKGIDFGFDSPPLTHLNTPDHVELM